MQVQRVCSNNQPKQVTSFNGELIRPVDAERCVKGVSEKQMQKFEQLIEKKINKGTNPSLKVGINGVKPYERDVNFVVVDEDGHRIFRKQNLLFRFQDAGANLDEKSGFYYNPRVSIKDNVENFWNLLSAKAKDSLPQ